MLMKQHYLFQNLHPEIKFTLEHNSKELPFLEILIKNQNRQIISAIYHKPIVTQLCHHPKSCIKSTS